VIIIFYLNDARVARKAPTSSRCVYLIDASLHLLKKTFSLHSNFIHAKNRKSKNNESNNAEKKIMVKQVFFWRIVIISIEE
jgi:hypothetical protein